MDLRMETSQAVSMLQPFRHPKPGLIIMDKAELKNICSRWLWKAFETGTKQDPFSADNSEYWHPAIDLKWSNIMADEINEHIKQVSRDRAIEFEKFLMKTSLDLTPNNESIEYAYDTWINQTQK